MSSHYSNVRYVLQSAQFGGSPDSALVRVAMASLDAMQNALDNTETKLGAMRDDPMAEALQRCRDEISELRFHANSHGHNLSNERINMSSAALIKADRALAAHAQGRKT